MAITTYICARTYGKRFTGPPIFLVQAFHHKRYSLWAVHERR